MAEILAPDLCVIGAGAGGLAAAEAALRLGASVVVVERGRTGGRLLEMGTLASKALVESARRAHAMRTAPAFGLAAAVPATNFARVRDHVRAAISNAAPGVSAEHVAALGARVVEGEGRFTDARTLAVAEHTVIRARRFIVATGSSPTLPVIAGLDAVPFFTSDTIFENTRKITHLVVVGLGAIGTELGQAYRRLGADVTLIEAGSTPLADVDPELAEVALRRLQEEGVLIRPGTEVPEVAPREGGGVIVTIRTAEGEDTLAASHLLVATGRAPNLDLGLDAAGIQRWKHDPTQLVLTGSLRTTNRRVYAIGDAAGGAQSVQAATSQADRAVRHALLGLPAVWPAAPAPVAIYSDPEIAWVGLDEPQARRRFGAKYRVVRMPFGTNDRARTQQETFGLCKLVTTPSGRILGAAVVGPQAGELISFFSLAIANRLGVQHLARFVAPYPTLALIVQQVAAAAVRDRPPPRWVRWIASMNRQLP